MSAGLVFVVPAHGRHALTAICLRRLAATCKQLGAAAVVIADDENLDTAGHLGFHTLERPNNTGLGRRFNDGFEWAAYQGATHVVPLGSDDWIDAALLEDLPDDKTVACFRSCALVSEHGDRIVRLRIPYSGGIGIRIMPCALLAHVGHRPAEDTRDRAVDASVIQGLHEASRRMAHGGGADLEYRESQPLQIVDFKSPRANLNTIEACNDYITAESAEPFVELADVYPAAAVAEMQALYTSRQSVAA